MKAPQDVLVVDQAAAAAALFQPLRQAVLAALDPPRSAAQVARQLELPRQKVNYHLRELERLGLVEEVEERRRGNCLERVLRPVARRFVVSSEALGEVGLPSSVAFRDRLSWAYLVGVAARAIRDLGRLGRLAQSERKRLPTLCLESEVRLADAQSLESFTADLTEAVAGVIERYHDEAAPRGRFFRLFLGAHPAARAPSDQKVTQKGGDDG